MEKKRLKDAFSSLVSEVRNNPYLAGVFSSLLTACLIVLTNVPGRINQTFNNQVDRDKYFDRCELRVCNKEFNMRAKDAQFTWFPQDVFDSDVRNCMDKQAEFEEARLKRYKKSLSRECASYAFLAALAFFSFYMRDKTKKNSFSGLDKNAADQENPVYSA